MPVLTQKLQARRQGKTLKQAVTHRILELDGDVTTLKVRRDQGSTHPREAAQLSRLIKLLNETIEELQAAL